MLKFSLRMFLLNCRKIGKLCTNGRGIREADFWPLGQPGPVNCRTSERNKYGEEFKTVDWCRDPLCYADWP